MVAFMGNDKHAAISAKRPILFQAGQSSGTATHSRRLTGDCLFSTCHVELGRASGQLCGLCYHENDWDSSRYYGCQVFNHGASSLDKNAETVGGETFRVQPSPHHSFDPTVFHG